MSDARTITIAGLTLEVIGYEFPASAEFWDANWLTVSAELTAPGACVQHMGTILRTDELDAFMRALQALDELRESEAKLECVEPNLSVSVDRDGSLGALAVQVSLTPDTLTQSHEVTFSSDLSSISNVVSEIKRVLRVFPVRHDRNV